MNIESLFYAYLKSDAALRTLLSGSAADTKIYRNMSRVGSAAPYVLHSLVSEGGTEEIIDDCRIEFKIVTDDYDFDTATAIRDRINTLLDLQDGIQSAIDGVLYCKKNGGMDINDPDTEQAVKIVTYDVKYKKS